MSIDHVQKQRTMHIEIHMHYIHGLVHDQIITLQYFPYLEQTTDIFTKIFTRKTFIHLISLLGVIYEIVKADKKKFVIFVNVHVFGGGFSQVVFLF